MLTQRYCLLPADLRDLSQLEAALEAAGLDAAAPTLVVSECVLVYLQPQHRYRGSLLVRGTAAGFRAV